MCSETEDGFERTWATNVLAPFILARALAPAVRRRIVNVSSMCSETEDGFERTWATNVLAPFILARALAPAVRRRIVNVSSISASPSLDTSDVHWARGYSAHGAYSLSKAAVQVRWSPPQASVCALTTAARHLNSPGELLCVFERRHGS